MVATTLDTNVLVTLLSADAAADVRWAQRALGEASALGELPISPVVHSKLLTAPSRDEAFLGTFLKDTRILADLLIGAHATKSGARLLSFDGGVYRSGLPKPHGRRATDPLKRPPASQPALHPHGLPMPTSAFDLLIYIE